MSSTFIEAVSKRAVDALAVAMQTLSLSEISDDVITVCLQRLSLQDLQAASNTCRTWHRVSRALRHTPAWQAATFTLVELLRGEASIDAVRARLSAHPEEAMLKSNCWVWHGEFLHMYTGVAEIRHEEHNVGACRRLVAPHRAAE